MHSCYQIVLCYSSICQPIALKMEGFMDDSASIRAFGLDVMTRVCERLIAGGVPGIHFYTLNQSGLTLELCKRLNLAPNS